MDTQAPYTAWQHVLRKPHLQLRQILSRLHVILVAIVVPVELL